VRVSAQLPDVLGQLDELVVLTDNAADDTPLLSTGDGAVTEACSSADNSVGTVDVLFWLNHDWALVPHKGLFEDFEDLLVKNRRFDTADSPLVLGDEQWGNGVLNTHDEVEELFEGLERQSLASPAEGVNTHAVGVARASRRGDEPLAVGTKDRELVSSQDTFAVVALGPHALRTLSPVGEVRGDFRFNKGQIRLNLSSRSIVVGS
jgi:hypothetical protein